MGRATDQEIAPPAQAAPRWQFGTSALFAQPAYRRLWVTGLCYYHAYMAEIVIAGWTVLQLTGSAFAVGLIGFSRMLPMLILGVVLGSLADRFRGHLLLTAVQVVGFCTTLTIAILFRIGPVPLWQLATLTGLLGCAWTCDFAVRRALITQLQEPAQISKAMALESVTMLTSKVGATALSGWLLAISGPSLAYGWLAVVYGIGILVTLRLRGVAATLPGEPPAAVALITLIRTGWTTAVGTPIVRALLLITVVMNLCVFCYQQIIAVIAEQILQVGPVPMGILAGADGIGAVIAASILMTRARPLHHGLVFLGGATGAAMLVIVLGLSHFYALSLAVQVVMGVCSTCFGAMQATIIAGAIAPALRARALGILAMAIGVTPFGILLSGALSSVVGPVTTLVSLGITALLLNAIVIGRNRTLVQAIP